MSRKTEHLIAHHAHAAAAAFVRSLIARDIDRAIAATLSGPAR